MVMLPRSGRDSRYYLYLGCGGAGTGRGRPTGRFIQRYRSPILYTGFQWGRGFKPFGHFCLP